MSIINDSATIPVATTPDIPGRTVASFVGPAFGVFVRSTGAAGNIKGTFKALRHGEVSEFTASVEEARAKAVERVVANARELGGDAVVGLRFDSTDLGNTQGLAEIVAYGTAVKLA